MKLKTVEVSGKTYAEVVDGKPVFEVDGKDVPFDGPAAVATITRVTDESKKFKERAQADEAKLKTFEGIADPAKALKALETVANLDAGKLIEAGKVEEMKAGIIAAETAKHANEKKSLSEKVDELAASLAKSDAAFFSEKVGGAFARSKFITEKTILPPDVAQATFGNRFKIEEGKIIGLGADGQPIYSKSKAGEIADFDEAIESMLDGHPNRDRLLVGTGQSGTGKKGNEGGGSGGKTVARSEFSKLDPTTQMTRMREGYQLVDG